MIALVAGASGYSGGHLVRALRSRGICTIAHIRPDSPELESKRKKLEILGAEVETSAWEVSAMTELLRMRRPTHIFSCLGLSLTRFLKQGLWGQASFENVDLRLNRILIDAALDCGTTPCFVLLSVTGINPRVPGSFSQVKCRLEDAVQKSGLPYVIARSSVIYGPDRDADRHIDRISALMVNGPLGFVQFLGRRELADRFRSITGDELALGMIKLAMDPAMINRVVETDALRS